MHWFFCSEEITSDEYTITGEDASHISRSLRMRAGERLTLCSKYQTEYTCEITDITDRAVTVRILSETPCVNEPELKVTLFQAVTKGEKFDLIVQKAVELGVSEIVPVLTSRCVSRPDEKSAAKKATRWQKISRQAAMQSRRGVIPNVLPLTSFEKALEYSKNFETSLLFYEGGGESISRLLNRSVKSAAVFIGSEGGFSPAEVEAFQKSGGRVATLGRRILRAETAPLAALSIIMFQTGNFD